MKQKCKKCGGTTKDSLAEELELCQDCWEEEADRDWWKEIKKPKVKNKEYKKKNKKNWKDRFWEILDNSEFLRPTPPCYVDWNKVQKFIELTIAKARKDAKKRTIRKLYKFLFKDLSGKSLDDKEAILCEKYPFIVKS